MSKINIKDLKTIVENCKFKPFNYLGITIGQKKLEKYYLDKINRAPNLCALFKKEEAHQIAGIGSWAESKWDARNIGYHTAKINFLITQENSFENRISNYKELYHSLEKEFLKNGFEYIFCRVNSSDLPLIYIFQTNGFHIVDGLLTQSILINDYKNEESNSYENLVRDAEKTDMEAVKYIAYNSFIFDRFHSDPMIPNKTANQLHANWIEDSFSKNVGEKVLVAEKDGVVLGFLSYSINQEIENKLGIKIITIILLATHPEFRGKGVAKQLVQSAIKLGQREKFEVVQVGTQLRNIKAISLYQSLEFQVVDTTYAYRKLLSPGTP